MVVLVKGSTELPSGSQGIVRRGGRILWLPEGTTTTIYETCQAHEVGNVFYGLLFRWETCRDGLRDAFGEDDEGVVRGKA